MTACAGADGRGGVGTSHPHSPIDPGQCDGRSSEPNGGPVNVPQMEDVVKAFPTVRVAQSALASAVVALAVLGNPAKSTAQSLPTPTCAWPFEWTAYGLGNWLFPDIGNRWWYMPIDPQWESLTISGVYPEARFFSFAVYDDAPVSTALADHLFEPRKHERLDRTRHRCIDRLAHV